MLSTKDSERGATALIIASALLLLVGMAAIAIDAGVGFTERRQDQTSADMGVLAGTMDFLTLGVCGDLSSDGCNQALDYVGQNLTQSYSSADWIDLWRDCRDPNKPTGFSPLRVSPSNGWTGFVGYRSDGTQLDDNVDCISASFNELRIRVPDQLTDTNFAQVIGTESLTTNAFAQARIAASPGADPIIPYGVPNGTAGHECVLSPGAGVAEEPCNGGTTGNFGAILSQLWGSDTSIMNCSTSSAAYGEAVRFHSANGLDHPLGVIDSSEYATLPASVSVFDTAVNTTAGQTANPYIDAVSLLDLCTNSGGTPTFTDIDMGDPTIDEVPPIDTVLVDTGANYSSETLQGFITGTPSQFTGEAVDPSTLAPRLRLGDCGTHGSPGPEPQLCLSLGSEGTHLVDNRPILDFVDTSIDASNYEDPNDPDPTVMCGPVGSTPPSASPSGSMTIEHLDCILRSGDLDPATPIFSSNITDSRRFVYVPEFYYASLDSGGHWQPIIAFKVAYIHTLWFNTPGPDVMWMAGDDPGVISLTNPNALQGLSAFVIPNEALPISVRNGCPVCVDAQYDVELTR